MFSMGMPEILMILAIALIIIGPKKLPELAKTLGHAMGEFKRSARDFKRSIDVEAAIKDFDETDIEEPNLKDTIKNPEEKTNEDQTPLKEDSVYQTEDNTPDPDIETDSVDKESSSSHAAAAEKPADKL